MIAHLGYRIMQEWDDAYYVEHYSPLLFGLFWKWRPLGTFVGLGVEVPIYFKTAEKAAEYANAHAKFGAGPKVVDESLAPLDKGANYVPNQSSS